MTLKHYNECDRCGAKYQARHPDEVIFMRLPNKIIPAAPVKGKRDPKPEQGPLLMIPLPSVPGISPEDMMKQLQPKEPDHVFCEFCPECEISLIAWFDVKLWAKKSEEWV